MSVEIQKSVSIGRIDRGPISELGTTYSITKINQAVVRRWNEEIWKGNDAVFRELLDPQCIFHLRGGIAEMQETVRRIRHAFSGIRIVIHDLFASDDKVVTRWTLEGKHAAKLWDAKPTGKAINYSGITINRLENGRIVEEWYESDIYGLMEQLEVLPL